MEPVDINQIDINLVQFVTEKGTVDINPLQVAMILNEEKKFNNSCVIFLCSGVKCIVSEKRADVVRKLLRLR